MAMLMLLPLLTIAQTEGKIIYIEDANHLKDCKGGTGRCLGSVFEQSNERTTAAVTKISKNQLEVTLDKTGFSAKEWEEMLTNKVFPIDDDSNITIDGELLRTLAIETKYNTIKAKNYSVTLKSENAIFILELVER